MWPRIWPLDNELLCVVLSRAKNKKARKSMIYELLSRYESSTGGGEGN